MIESPGKQSEHINEYWYQFLCDGSFAFLLAFLLAESRSLC